MRNNQIVLSILAVFAVFAVSCKKDKTKVELLTEKAWLTTAIAVNPGIPAGNEKITDLFAQFQPCVNDNILTFSSDKTYSEEEGATKCNSSDSQMVEMGKWSFNEGETVLTKVGTDKTTRTFDLIELNATTLKMSEAKSLHNDKYTLSYTLIAK
jgi:Lipocalin-like domain